MEYWINLEWPLDYWQLEKIYDFYEVRGNTIIWHFHIDGLDLTNWQIRGELYDLNTSIKMASENAGPISAPEITVDDAVNGRFTATVAIYLTAAMQKFAQVEFQLTSPSGQQFTILQQAVRLVPQRIIWTNEAQESVVEEDDGENPLF